MELFRREVIEAQDLEGAGSWGRASVAPLLSYWSFTGVMVAIGVGFLALLMSGHYTRRETVHGELVPTSGLLTLTTSATGTVVQVHVRNGQPVKAGDALLELATERFNPSVGDTYVYVLEQLESRKDSLNRDLDLQQRSARERADSLKDQVKLLTRQQRKLEEQKRLALEDITGSLDLLDRMQRLISDGYVSLLQIQQQRAELISAKTNYKDLERQQLEVDRALNAARQDLIQLPLESAARHNDVMRTRAEINQSIANVQTDHALIVRAPRDGILTSVLPKPGQSVTANQPVASILPVGATLEAQLLVPSRAIGFIDRGNRVVLRYAAFPYQKFGQQYGHISDVSRSALSPSEVAALTEKQVTEPLYRVQVTLDAQTVNVYGHSEPVRPGMAVDADILLENRRLIEWLLEPLYGLRHRTWIQG